MSQEEIDYENNKIAQLRQQSKNLVMPRRSIAYQFKNMRYGNRNIVQELAIRRKQRKKIDSQINESKKRIILLLG